jgi:hypothetical protein
MKKKILEKKFENWNEEELFLFELQAEVSTNRTQFLLISL